MFGLITDVRGKTFANHTVPIGTILLIKLIFDMLGHLELDLDIINCPFCLLLYESILLSLPQPACLNLQAYR